MKLKPKYPIVILPDLHAPNTRGDVFEWLLGFCKGAGTVVQLGDWLDADAVSGFPSDALHTLRDEYEYAARQANAIRTAAPDAQLIRMVGNHEYRLLSGKSPGKLRSTLHWSAHPTLGEEWGRWREIPYTRDRRGIVDFGRVACWHGFDCSKGSCRTESVEMFWHTDKAPDKIMVRGHTHRVRPPQHIELVKDLPIPIQMCNVGTAGPLDPEYAARSNRMHWGSACLVVDKTSHEFYTFPE